MAKQKQEIEEAVIVTEPTAILVTDFKAPVLPKLINKEQSIATIKESLKTYEDVVIDGTKDKVNYALVAKGMKEMKDSRLAWKKAVTENLSQPVIDWLAETKLDISAIEDTFKEGESLLRTKKEAIDNLKTKEKEEAEAAKLKVMTQRIETIVNLGGKSDGTRYLFDYDITLFVSLANMKDLDEKKWLPVLKEIQDAWHYEQKRLADQKLIEEQLAEANATKEKELKDKQTKLRIKELNLNGFLATDRDGNFWEHTNGHIVADVQINDYTDEEWDQLIEGVQFAESLEDNEEEEEDLDDTSLTLAQDQELNDGVPQGTYSGGIIFPEGHKHATVAAIDHTADNNVDLPFADDEPETEVDLENGDSVQYTLDFNTGYPYVEFPKGKGFIERIFLPRFADYAHELTESQQLVLEGDIEGDLKFVLIKIG